MKLNKYKIKLPLILISLCLLGAVFNLANMTDSRYNAIQSILSLRANNLTSNLIEDKPGPLGQFYGGLVRDVAKWRIPRGYELKEAYFKTGSGTKDVLSAYQNEGLEVALNGDAKFIMKVSNEKSSITCESFTSIDLKPSHIWEVNNQIQVRIRDKKYFFVSLSLSGAFVVLLLFVSRRRGAWVILGSLLLFLILTISKQFVKEEYFYVLRYMDIATSVLVLVTLVSFYFVQSGELATYHEMHNMYSYQFKTYVITAISIVLSVFNHNLVVNIINWFVWVPILQCYVFHNYEEILDREHKRNIAMEEELEKIADEFDDMKLDDVESMQQYSDFHQRKRKNFRPYLMLIHIAIFMISLIVCFKKENYFKTTREVDEAMSSPFTVDGMNVLEIKNFVKNEEEPTVRFEISKTVERVEVGDISLITSNKVLKAWVESFLKRVTFNRSLIVFKELGQKGEYRLYNDKNMEKLAELNIKMLFIFETAKEVMTTAEINIGENKVSTTLKNLNVLTFGLKQNKYLGILVFFNCLVLIGALIFTGKKDKSKFRTTLIAFLLVINLCFCFSLFYLIPRLIRNINSEINIMEGRKLLIRKCVEKDEENIRKFLKNVIVFMWMRKGVTVIVFLCILALIAYITVSMPKEYSTYNQNMTNIRRQIKTDWKNLRILIYQFTILILISTLIGHEAFGHRYEEFRNELLSLRYNFIMMFNKFLIEPKAEIRSVIYLYHRVAIFVFYNVVLTAFLATFYFQSCTRRNHWFQKTPNLLVFPKPGDFNFDVNIKATYDEILAFKVFLKSFHSYKDHIKSNEPDKEDECEQFMATFSQSKEGLGKITFNGDQYVYLERIKRFILCIVFLRIKIGSCNSKIKELEEQKEKKEKQNNNKKEYLILLQKKLKETIEEVDKFKSKNKILELIELHKKEEKESKNEEKLESSEPMTKYDTKQLEMFITNPNGKKGNLEQIEEDEELTIKEEDDNNDTNNDNNGDNDNSNNNNMNNETQTQEDELEDEKELEREPDFKENQKEDPVEEPLKVDKEEGKEEEEREKECSNEQKQKESEKKTEKITLKRPEKRKKKREDIGIFKSNILKKHK